MMHHCRISQKVKIKNTIHNQVHDQNGYDVVMMKADIKKKEIYCYEKGDIK